MRFAWSRIGALLKGGRSLGSVMLVGALFAMPPLAGPPPCTANAAQMPHATAHPDDVPQAAGAPSTDPSPWTMPCCGTFAQLPGAVVESSCVSGTCPGAAAAPFAASMSVALAPLAAHAPQLSLPWRSYYSRSSRILR